MTQLPHPLGQTGAYLKKKIIPLLHSATQVPASTLPPPMWPSTSCRNGCMRWANTQHTTLNIQHSTYNTQHTTLNIQHSTYNTQQTTLNIQHSTYNTQHTTLKYNTQHTTLNKQHSIYNTQHTTLKYNTQHTTLNIQHSTYNTQHKTLNTHHSTFNKGELLFSSVGPVKTNSWALTSFFK